MGEWETLGPMVWVRFRALGVEQPLERAADWVRSHGQATRTVLLADSARWAMASGAGTPDPVALEALGVSLANVAVLRRRSVALWLSEVDGVDIGSAAAACGTTVAAIDAERTSIEENLVDDALPEGSQEDGHVDTMRMCSLIQEDLAPMQRGQVEDHIESCSWCTERYLVWMQLVEEFAELPEPPPPPKKSYTVPALLMIAGSTASMLSVLAVAFLALASGSQKTQDKSWRHRAPVVTLERDGTPVDAGSLEPGQTVSVRFDSLYAPFAGAAVRRGDAVEQVMSGAVNSPGSHLLPVDLVVGSHHETVYVVLSDAPLPEDLWSRVAAGEPPAEVAVTPVVLR